MRRAATIAAALFVTALLPCGPLAARAADAPVPDLTAFSGTWRLDLAASRMGEGPRVPRWREDRIRSAGAEVAVHMTSVRPRGDTLRLDYRYATGGESVNRMAGQEVRTRGRRDGAALVFESEAQLALFKFEVSERWSLSADGGTLTQERMSRSPTGEERQRLVFRRVREPGSR